MLNSGMAIANDVIINLNIRRYITSKIGKQQIGNKYNKKRANMKSNYPVTKY